jgi:hypothetical protein
LPVEAIFSDSDGVLYQGSTFDLEMAGLEIYALQFEQLGDNLRNMQVFIFSAESEYATEAVFDNFQGAGNKVASVSSGVGAYDFNFFMNIDRRQDLFTGNFKLRGLAVTNSSVGDCDCQVTLWDRLGAEVGLTSVLIPPTGKFVGPVSALFPNIDQLIPDGLGLLDFACSQQVGVTGLSFENGTPITGSVPIDFYIVVDKQKIRLD